MNFVEYFTKMVLCQFSDVGWSNSFLPKLFLALNLSKHKTRSPNTFISNVFNSNSLILNTLNLNVFLVEGIP